MNDIINMIFLGIVAVIIVLYFRDISINKVIKSIKIKD